MNMQTDRKGLAQGFFHDLAVQRPLKQRGQCRCSRAYGGSFPTNWCRTSQETDGSWKKKIKMAQCQNCSSLIFLRGYLRRFLSGNPGPSAGCSLPADAYVKHNMPASSAGKYPANPQTAPTGLGAIMPLEQPSTNAGAASEYPENLPP